MSDGFGLRFGRGHHQEGVTVDGWVGRGGGGDGGSGGGNNGGGERSSAFGSVWVVLLAVGYVRASTKAHQEGKLIPSEAGFTAL